MLRKKEKKRKNKNYKSNAVPSWASTMERHFLSHRYFLSKIRISVTKNQDNTDDSGSELGQRNRNPGAADPSCQRRHKKKKQKEGDRFPVNQDISPDIFSCGVKISSRYTGYADEQKSAQENGKDLSHLLADIF